MKKKTYIESEIDKFFRKILNTKISLPVMIMMMVIKLKLIQKNY